MRKPVIVVEVSKGVVTNVATPALLDATVIIVDYDVEEQGGIPPLGGVADFQAWVDSAPSEGEVQIELAGS